MHTCTLGIVRMCVVCFSMWPRDKLATCRGGGGSSKALHRHRLPSTPPTGCTRGASTVAGWSVVWVCWKHTGLFGSCTLDKVPGQSSWTYQDPKHCCCSVSWKKDSRTLSAVLCVFLCLHLCVTCANVVCSECFLSRSMGRDIVLKLCSLTSCLWMEINSKRQKICFFVFLSFWIMTFLFWRLCEFFIIVFLCVGAAARVRLTLKQKVVLFPSFTFVHGNISAWGIFKSRVLSIATQLNRFHFISGRKCPYQLQSTPVSTHWSAASSKHSHLEACYTAAPLHYWNVFIHSTSEHNKKITHMHLVPKMVLSNLFSAPALSLFI